MKVIMRSDGRELIIGALIAFSALAQAPATGSVASRRTIYLLIDESGTMKADSAGWRKHAASMLAQALPDGSSMAIAGFGDSGRKVDLRLRYLDNSNVGVSNRREIAGHAETLGDRDRRTDIYGAIRQAIEAADRRDDAAKGSSPAAIVVLSDFQPDPEPTEAERASLCDAIRRSKTDLALVGFGKVNFEVQKELAACAGTTPTGTVAQPAQLMDAFWKLQRRFTNSLRIESRKMAGEVAIVLSIPKWADEVVLLAYSESGSKPIGDWDWRPEVKATLSEGTHFRLARISESAVSDSKGSVRVALQNTSGITFTAIARGELVLRVQTEPTPPWLSGESVRIEGELVSTKTGSRVTEWMGKDAPDYAAIIRTGSKRTAELGLGSQSAVFRGSFVAPLGRFVGVSELHLDGAFWRSELEADTSWLPVDLGLDEQGRLELPQYAPGLPEKKLVRSLLPARSFDVAFQLNMDSGEVHQGLHFDASQQSAELTLVPSDWNASVFLARLPHLLDQPAPRVGSLKVTTKLASGQIVQSQTAIPVVLRVRPLWFRLLILLAALAPIAIAVIYLVCGRKLPRLHLVACDLKGRATRGAEVVAIGDRRRRFDLSVLGLRGVAIRQPLFGKAFVDLSRAQDARVLLSGEAEFVGGDRVAISEGDVICTRSKEANSVRYRVEKL
jgi:hypothetical protein